MSYQDITDMVDGKGKWTFSNDYFKATEQAVGPHIFDEIKSPITGHDVEVIRVPGDPIETFEDMYIEMGADIVDDIARKLGPNTGRADIENEIKDIAVSELPVGFAVSDGKIITIHAKMGIRGGSGSDERIIKSKVFRIN